MNFLLLKYNCILAHCFTLDNPQGDIYDRIIGSITNVSTYELSSSTIHKGDTAYENYYSGLGVIIEKPRITFSSPEDGGTKRLSGTLIFNDEIGTENPSFEMIEYAIRDRKNYNEFLVRDYKPIGIFISRDVEGWAFATQAINKDLKTFYERTKVFNLPYYFIKNGYLTLIEFDSRLNKFIKIKSVDTKDLYKMENVEKAKIFDWHFLSERSIAEMEKINCYSDFIKLLEDEDFVAIDRNSVYFNCFYSPGSMTKVRYNIPIKSKLINIDLNYLKGLQPRERIAILLHELGHAINPEELNNETNEFNADDFAIAKGFGSDLRNSLITNIKKNPSEYDKEITRKRIERIKVK